MAGIPKIRITFDADFAELKKGVKGAQAEVEGFGSKIGDFGKKAGLAFAAAGVAAAAYAGKLLIEGVQSAIADEAAQAKLATTLQNVTGATDAQIAATEAYITATSLANGITDDDLRPSLDRLLRSTKDVTEAQALQQIALDVSAGSGKSLSAVSEALAKAYDGNFAALKKLGIPIDESIIKAKDFDGAMAALSATFEGQAAKQADTFQGKMLRLGVAFDEVKETVGSYVLDAITPLISSFVDKGIPAISKFADGLGKTLGPAFAQIFAFIRDELLPVLVKWWTFLYTEVIPAIGKVVGPILIGLKNAFNTIKTAISDNSEELAPFFSLLKKIWEFIKTYLAPILGGAFKIALEAIGSVIGTLVTGFSNLVGFITGAFNILKKFVDLIANNPLIKGISGVIDNVFGGGRAMGGPVKSSTSYLVGEQGPEIFTPNTSGMITPNHRLGGSNGNTYNITVNGAIDAEGTARTIIDVLNRSAARGGGGYNALVSV
jgi:hypothetical protein